MKPWLEKASEKRKIWLHSPHAQMFPGPQETVEAHRHPEAVFW